MLTGLNIMVCLEAEAFDNHCAALGNWKEAHHSKDVLAQFSPITVGQTSEAILGKSLFIFSYVCSCDSELQIYLIQVV